MLTEYHILKTNENLVDEIIFFFTSQATNPTLFDDIKKVCIAKANIRQTDKNLINMGYLSGMDFLNYMSDKRKCGTGIDVRFVEIVLHQLTENYILTPLDSILFRNKEQRYRANGVFTSLLFERDLIKNLIYGFKYIIDSYQKSVFKIEQTSKNDDKSIGTGFLIADTNNENSIIVTNKHVVAGRKELKIYTFEDKEIKIENINEDEDRDIALIEIEKLNDKTFYLNSNPEILSEVLTIGYPSVPMTNNSYQLFHKGEINSIVEDYHNNKLIIFSAKTSSGNSGSPIIDKTGLIVGIVTSELFEKESFQSKGKLPYYAGIPSAEILKTIDKFIKD
ncbi:MAG TPA: hypothetical protein DDX39_12145 [Bacteroidales bacterium]|nr:MAG: hypothetical protein A2W98_11550 [Bacteroidetes bacterium GWF2_33_38]HBF89383.1 hypothetical protein [Bacteroidales bacterium]